MEEYSGIPVNHTKPGNKWGVLEYSSLGTWKIHTFSRKEFAQKWYTNLVEENKEASLVCFQVYRFNRIFRPI